MLSELQRNPYADHLAEVNKTNPVLASKDIYNELGAIIVPVGTPIDEEVCNRIARFKLGEPIELSVNLEFPIPPQKMFQDIQDSPIVLVDELDDLYSLFKQELMHQCGNCASIPLLTQKLTVMEERMPPLYKASQCISGIALTIALHMGLDEETIEVIFITAQMHDSGVLNMSPEQVQGFAQLDDARKNEFLREQLALGAEFLSNVPKLSERVRRAVLEHKERLDGSGWPEGLLGDQFCIESQVVGVATMLHEAFINHLLPKGYGACSLYPILQVEGEGFEMGVYNATAQLLMPSSSTARRFLPEEFIPPVIRYICVLQKALVHWLELAKNCAGEMLMEAESPSTVRSDKIVAGLESLFRNSGLWEQELLSWLEDVSQANNTEEYKEVELVAIMFDLVLEKLKRLHWSLTSAAKGAGQSWLDRCEELGSLILSIPKNHYFALETYDCL